MPFRVSFDLKKHHKTQDEGYPSVFFGMEGKYWPSEEKKRKQEKSELILTVGVETGSN